MVTSGSYFGEWWFWPFALQAVLIGTGLSGLLVWLARPRLRRRAAVVCITAAVLLSASEVLAWGTQGDVMRLTSFERDGPPTTMTECVVSRVQVFRDFIGDGFQRFAIRGIRVETIVTHPGKSCCPGDVVVVAYTIFRVPYARIAFQAGCH
jgi:hypothetical protein